ncbi:MAG: sporulation protein YqfD [Bacillota bacterium]
MFIIKWWRYCRGYLIISLKGRGVERLLNLSIARGIGFWDLHKQPAGARLSIYLSSFRVLRPLIRQTHCRLHIIRKAGLPFWSYRLRRRWGLVLGFLFFCAALYVSTSLVWFIRITGTKELEQAEVLRLVGELGVRPGVWKRKIDLLNLEEELARRHGTIAWVGARLRGTLLEIEIVEHLPEPDLDDRPADLVAAKDGLIMRVLVLEGSAVIAPGDTVAKGDLLISGTIFELDPALPDYALPAAVVRARGEVEARVWYEGLAPLDQTEVIKNETGQSVKGYQLRWPQGSVRLWGAAASPYECTREEVLKTSWRWRNLSLPVELVAVTYHEIYTETIILTPEKARQRAEVEALALVQSQLPEDALVERIYYQQYSEQGRDWVRAVAETREDITLIRLLEP